jgi:hypothetical protein
MAASELRMGGEDGGAEVERDATAAERVGERGLGRIAQGAELAAVREVDERAVLRDHRVEHPVQVGAHQAQVGQHAASHQQELAPGRPHALERPRRGLGDPVGVGDRPVVVGGEGVHVHAAVSASTVSRAAITTVRGYRSSSV